MSEKYSSNNKWPMTWGAFEPGGYSYLSQAQTWLDLLDNASDIAASGKSKTLLTGSDKPVNRGDAGEGKKQNQQHFSDADAVAAISAMLGFGRIYKESPEQDAPEQVAQYDAGFLRETVDRNNREDSLYRREMFKDKRPGYFNAVGDTPGIVDVGVYDIMHDRTSNSGLALKELKSSTKVVPEHSQAEDENINKWYTIQEAKQAAIQYAREKLSADEAERFEKLANKISIFKPQSSFLPGTTKPVCGWTYESGTKIWITPVAFSNPDCGGLAQTIFHEILHLLGYPGTKAGHDTIRRLEMHLTDPEPNYSVSF